MANPIPPMPLRVPMTDDNGLLSTPWMAYFREIFTRIGGTSAQSNAELTASVTSIQESITNVQVGLDGLGQGRTL